MTRPCQWVRYTAGYLGIRMSLKSVAGCLTWVVGDEDLWYCLVLACCNNKLSRYDAVNHSAKCKYYKYGNIDIVVRTPESGIVLELCFYNIRLPHLIYYSQYGQYKLLFHWWIWETLSHDILYAFTYYGWLYFLKGWKLL